MMSEKKAKFKFGSMKRPREFHGVPSYVSKKVKRMKLPSEVSLGTDQDLRGLSVSQAVVAPSSVGLAGLSMVAGDSEYEHEPEVVTSCTASLSSPVAPSLGSLSGLSSADEYWSGSPAASSPGSMSGHWSDSPIAPFPGGLSAPSCANEHWSGPPVVLSLGSPSGLSSADEHRSGSVVSIPSCTQPSSAGPGVAPPTLSTPASSVLLSSSLDAPSTSVSPPTAPTQTATARKLVGCYSVRSKGQVLSDAECVGKGNRLIGCDALSQFVHLLRCPDCDSNLIVTEGVTNRRGLVTKLMVECEGEEVTEEERERREEVRKERQRTGKKCGWTHTLTDPYSQKAKSLNCMSVFGSRMIGKGRTGHWTKC